MAVPASVAKDLQAKLKAWRADAVLFVREVFHVEPDAWQEDALRILSSGGRVRLALKACAGPGKTAVLAWEGWRRLLCFGDKHNHPKGIALSISWDNLSDGLWAEMAKWRGVSPLLQGLFEWRKERIFAKDHPETWFLSARAYSKSADAEAIGRMLSGLHTKYPIYLIDESGDLPPAIGRSAEQGLTECDAGVILTAGNTTSDTGMLYHVSTVLRSDWDVITITGDPDDPKRSPRVDIDWARQQIDTYGRDNPWVMAYVLGQFPPGALNKLLSVEDVEAAMARAPRTDTFDWSEKRLGVDVARFGDDRTVIFPRQGIAAFNPVIMRVADTSQIAARVAQSHNTWSKDSKVDQIFIDDTGHWGHGVIDQLRTAHFPATGIQFHGPASNKRYANMRAQMWIEMSEWIKAGGALPPVQGLIKELTAPTYSFVGGKFILEDKAQIKKRTGSSPDLADALALTFAFPDRPKNTGYVSIGQSAYKCETEYDVFRDLLVS